MTAVVCRRCGQHWAWWDGEWCWRCIYDACCSRNRRCVHGDEIRDMYTEETLR